MSCIAFIVIVWFVAVTEQSLQNSTKPTLCQTGIVYVTCTLRKCRNMPDGLSLSTERNVTSLEQIELQLFKDGKMIDRSKSVRSTLFRAAFKNLKGENTTGFECVWKRNQTVVCRQEVLVDLQSIPAPVEELSISVQSNVPRMIVVEFSRPRRKHDEMLESAEVAAEYMAMSNARCSAEQFYLSRSDTRPCSRLGGNFVCANLFKRLVYLPAKFVATVKVENQIGRCSSSPFCKVLTYFDIYGGLQNVTGKFDIEHSTVRLLVSWKIPTGLRVGSANGVNFDVEYCSNKCSYQTESRSYSQLTNDAVTAKIYKHVAYKSKYQIRVRYWINDFGTNSTSPWASPIIVKVPSQIPKQLPKIRSCKELKNNLITVWRREDVDYYVLKIEESGKKDSYIKMSSTTCALGYCQFSLQRKSLDKAFGITVFPCSESGCNNKSDSNCYFKGIHSIDKSSNSQPTSQLLPEEIMLTVAPLAAVIAMILVSFLVVKVIQWRKRAASQGMLKIITPRHNSDSDSSYTPADCDADEYNGYDRWP